MIQTVLDQIAAKLGRDIMMAMEAPVLTLTGATGVIPVDRDGVTVLARVGAVIAATMAAPGAANIGRRKVVTTNTAFAHTVTWPGAIVNDGTAGANTTFTAVAVPGCSFEVVAIDAAFWNVLSFNLGAFAP